MNKHIKTAIGFCAILLPSWLLPDVLITEYKIPMLLFVVTMATSGIFLIISNYIKYEENGNKTPIIIVKSKIIKKFLIDIRILCLGVGMWMVASNTDYTSKQVSGWPILGTIFYFLSIIISGYLIITWLFMEHYIDFY